MTYTFPVSEYAPCKPDPLRPLKDTEGNLYGTTYGGGLLGYFGCGVVFKLDPLGNETLLYSFGTAAGYTDGCQPRSGLVAEQISLTKPSQKPAPEVFNPPAFPTLPRPWLGRPAEYRLFYESSDHGKSRFK
jgi:uncharacterized repeat protein (TIGR03803 family)